MNDAARRREMRNAGLATLDGDGAARIAADLAAALKEEKAPVRDRADKLAAGLRERPRAQSPRVSGITQRQDGANGS